MPRSIARSLPRRRALRLITGGASAALLGEFGAAFTAFLRPLRAVAAGSVVEAGPADAILARFRERDDEPFYVRAGRCFILHAPDGLLAVSGRCTHLGCAYAYAPAEGQFHCPCHSSLFDKRTGVVLGGPATRPLDLLPIRIENGVVAVDAEDGRAMRRAGYDAAQATRV
jgi:Rieske Fe-S protein